MRSRFILLAIVVIVAVIGVYKFVIRHESAANQPASANQPQADQAQPNVPLIDLQPTVDAWAAKLSGQASVVVIDLANKKNIAVLNPDRQYFTASIYKLYVAYVGYQKVADGTYNFNDPYLSGYSRGRCLDVMIRDSYSPCGEKMWIELGKNYLTKRMEDYGLKNTSLNGLYTSASDAAIILQRLFERRDLTEAHTQSFLDSLKTQDAKYRRGLPSGFSAETTAYNKVGWNEQVEWHDTAIITLTNGRNYVVTVMTKNVGSSNIASLAKAIEAKLTQ